MAPNESKTTARLLACALAALAIGLAACPGSEPTIELTCTSDAECGAPGTRCDVSAQRCICVEDEACEDGQFCNNAGVCQDEAGCTSNLDCRDANTYCDILSGQCLEGEPLITEAQCGLATHCGFGLVCEEGRCVPGCFDDGDCPLGEVCFDGQCATGLCGGDSYCEYGERCRENLQCVTDTRGPYCRSCSPRTGANPNPCDDGRNFCLINNRELGGFANFCGVDCSLGQPCPNGYQCGGVIILTQQQCLSEADCRCDRNSIRFATKTCTVAETCDPRLPNGQPDPDADRCLIEGVPDCSGGAGDGLCIVSRGQRSGNCTCVTDDDCGGNDGATCVGGLCCTGNVRPEGPRCVGGEGTIAGFCTCGTDNDCPQDVCDGTSGRCTFTGRPCTPGAGDCTAIPCSGGGCLIGQNCAPVQGLTCSEVLGN